MDIYTFADRFLRPYKVKNDEIIPTFCPFCKGGEHRDRDSFALNITNKTYNCKRGKCSKRGHFSELCKDFGVEADRETTRHEIIKPREVIYKKPQVTTGELSIRGIEYAAKRQISEATLKHFRVAEKDGMYVFPIYENNELVMIKYRPIGKIDKTKGQKKGFREPDGKPVLFGIDLIDTTEPLVITEGEFDAFAVYESGWPSVVSVPSGSSDLTWIDLCWEILEKVPKIIIFGDNDVGGQKMIKSIIQRLGIEKCYIADHPYKDANEVLYFEGKDKVLECIISAKSVPKDGIIDVSDIEPTDKSKTIGVPTGFRGLDRKIEDCRLGEITIWTGRNAEGKSTILGQVILEALNEGYSVFAYSGELTAERFQSWINTQAAGEENLETFTNRYGDKKTKVKTMANNRIREWYRGRFFLYDNSVADKNIEGTSIIDLCRYAAKRHNCKVFIIDNLMTADFKTYGDNYYQAQSQFVGELKSFARNFNIHVHIVAHPKKTEHKEIQKEDVGGMAEITNRADNVIAIERNFDPQKDYDALMRLLKNRENGELANFPLMFSSSERRFYQKNLGGVYDKKYYEWSKSKEYQGFFDISSPSPWDK